MSSDHSNGSGGEGSGPSSTSRPGTVTRHTEEKRREEEGRGGEIIKQIILQPFLIIFITHHSKAAYSVKVTDTHANRWLYV